jgi:hypothetical protein
MCVCKHVSAVVICNEILIPVYVYICMYIPLSMCVCVCIYISIYVFIYINIHQPCRRNLKRDLDTYIYVHTCIHITRYQNLITNDYSMADTCLHTHIYIYIYIHVYIYI